MSSRQEGMDRKTIWPADDISFKLVQHLADKALHLFRCNDLCCKTHIFNTDAYLKFHEGKGNLVTQCTLISVSNCYSRGLT